MKLGKLISTILIFLLIFPSLTLAQQTGTEALSWISTLGSWSIMFWLFGGLCIFLGLILFRPLGSLSLFKGFVYLGIILIFFGTFAVQIAYVLPYLGKPVLTYTTCESAFPSSTAYAQNPVNSFIISIACLFNGYAPADLSGLGVATFFIFGIIAPLGVLIALLYEFTDFLENKNARNVVTFLAALISYRFLLASMFVEILGYGFAGLGILVINYFFFMVLLRMIAKMWKWQQAAQEAISVTDREIFSDYLRKWEDMQLHPQMFKPEEIADMRKKIDDLKKKLDI